MTGKMPIGLRIAIIDRTFKRRMDERAREMGLTSVQLRVLGEISLMEASGISEINQRDLENAEQVTHPTMTGVIKRLENKGFVKCVTSPTDKRYKKISCTEKSTGIHQKIAAQDEDVLSELCIGLTPNQTDEFIHLTDLILKNITM
ncbi:MAG: MarR family winged helix-turn-helix transcriptional regulator [Lachnospiraceae bacterium]